MSENGENAEAIYSVWVGGKLGKVRFWFNCFPKNGLLMSWLLALAWPINAGDSQTERVGWFYTCVVRESTSLSSYIWNEQC